MVTPIFNAIAYRLLISGKVQGIGFRPYVYKLAQQFKLCGWVRNTMGMVEIHIQGQPEILAAFVQQILYNAPPLATPCLNNFYLAPVLTMQGFSILDSLATGPANIHLPFDLSTCDACLGELYDAKDRRYRYPFLNCTQCGPRYTIINNLPYDRAATTMAGFALCPACHSEYIDPGDRRFHAEPLACAMCGPLLSFRQQESSAGSAEINRMNLVTTLGISSSGGGENTVVCQTTSSVQYDNESALQAAVAALRAGAIIAVRGIGGYHLCCAADQEAVIVRLRRLKSRPHKPLAVMFPTPPGQPLREVLMQVNLSPDAAALLLSPMRPIVLAHRRPDATLSAIIAPGLDEIGVLLPYSPLYYLLLADLGSPIIATSANLSGEPVLTDPAAVETRLSHVATAFLHHNRPIARPADDPVYRSIGGQLRPLRLGRGNAPLELLLPIRLQQPLLAVGGQSKTTVALAWEKQVLLSPHIGDLNTPRSLSVFIDTIADLQNLYKVKAKMVLCDAHPGYASTRWAKQCGLPWHAILHHHAHAATVYGDANGTGDWLVFTWDGLGYAEDGTLGGGEALLGHPGHWSHFASWRPFRLPGGERASLEPWRSAAALCWTSGREVSKLPPGADLAQHAWKRNLNSPQTTAVGRLFDAAAALLGLCHYASFDGQAPMLVEAAYDGDPNPLDLPFAVTSSGLWVSDWEPLLPMLMDETLTLGTRAAYFHATLAYTMLKQARQARTLYGITKIGLGGGVLQNQILTNLALQILTGDHFTVTIPSTVPINDAGISYGQIVEYCGSTRT